MSESLNVNVLVAAKEEYTKQFIALVENYYITLLEKIYKDSQLKNERRKLSISNFQQELKNVRHWSEFKIEENFKTMNLTLPYLMDLMTAIFVSHVKILASVRLKGDGKSIKIKVPNLNKFLHTILINICEVFYYEPYVYFEDKDKLNLIINNSINDAFSKQIPIDYILKEYLAGVFDEDEEENFEDEKIPEQIPLVPIEPPIDNNFYNLNKNPEFDNNIQEDKYQSTFNPNPEIEKEQQYDNLLEEENDNIKDFTDLKNKNKNDVKINKKDIDIDSDEESEIDDDAPDNEEYENLGNEESKEVKETTLF